ncbi:MAG: choice-of-anchor D domain-containing protein [Betaproteobacteria bacterium]
MLARALAVLLVAAVVAAPDARAQTGQQKYATWCQGCHGPAANNKDGVLGGKDWNIIKLAMDTKPDMTSDLRPFYNQGLLTDDDFMLIAGYLQTFQGGVTSQLGMPAAIAFGSVGVGIGSAVVARNIATIGNAAVQLSSTVTSSNPLEFPIVSTTCTSGAFVLPASAGCSVSVQFIPVTTGARSAQINVVSNGIGSPQSFAVSGTGGTGGPPATGTLTMPASVPLGSQAVGVQSAGTNFTVSNGSGTAVTVSSVLSNSVTEFPIVGNSCGTVAASGSCTVTVAFKPATSGARSGIITISSNGTGSPQTVVLSGTGTSAPPPPSGLTIPSSLSLGSQAVGVQTAGSNISVSNPGGSPISISSIVTSPTAEFPIVGNSCGVVAAGGSCTITIAFRPFSAGLRTGSMTVTSNGSGSPNVVALSGTGTATAPTASKVPVVEYYNAGFGHYFMTADADEIAGLDAGAFNFAFVRTGRLFNGWNGPQAGTVPVCRFFTLTFAPKSSHFYTADPVECDGLKFNPNWQYEKIAFYIALPVNGVCPIATTPIYRMYNNGQTGAPNHRFASDFTVYQDFTTNKNWAPEGTGFCSPN